MDPRQEMTPVVVIIDRDNETWHPKTIGLIYSRHATRMAWSPEYPNILVIAYDIVQDGCDINNCAEVKISRSKMEELKKILPRSRYYFRPATYPSGDAEVKKICGPLFRRL